MKKYIKSVEYIKSESMLIDMRHLLGKAFQLRFAQLIFDIS